jgi:hypothetical protein
VHYNMQRTLNYVITIRYLWNTNVKYGKTVPHHWKLWQPGSPHILHGLTIFLACVGHTYQISSTLHIPP